MLTGSYDAIVIGAGPAGCGVTRLLAAWGHRVLLIDRPGDAGRHRAESVPPSAQKALAALGMLTSVEDARFSSWLGNTVWWADDPSRVERFPPGAAGYHVRRDRFDARLRELAGESGADILTGIARDVSVPGVTPPHDVDRAQPTVHLERDGAVRSIRLVSGQSAARCNGFVKVCSVDFRRRFQVLPLRSAKADGFKVWTT